MSANDPDDISVPISKRPRDDTMIRPRSVRRRVVLDKDLLELLNESAALVLDVQDRQETHPAVHDSVDLVEEERLDEIDEWARREDLLDSTAAHDEQKILDSLQLTRGEIEEALKGCKANGSDDEFIRCDLLKGMFQAAKIVEALEPSVERVRRYWAE